MIATLFRPVPVGRIFGIPILLVPAVLLLLAVVVAPFVGGGGGELGAVLLLFVVLAVSLLAHELGHALMARALGLRVLDITIWPLGGMARLEGMAERPQAEAPVAAAGPLVNLALAALCWPLPWQWAEVAMWINLFLGLGNLVPAFPLDGGRLLRSWLARASPMSDATFAAVRVGRWLTLLGVILLVGNGHWFVALLLGVYLWWSGQAEFLQTVLRSGRPPTLTVGAVFSRAWRFRRTSPADGEGEVEPPEERGAESATEEELEEFHGTLDEYFDRRR